MRWRGSNNREQSSDNSHECTDGESSIDNNDHTNFNSHELIQIDDDEQDFSDHHRYDDDEDEENGEDVEDMAYLNECMNETNSMLESAHPHDPFAAHSNFTAISHRRQQQSQTPSSSGSCHLPPLPPSDTISDIPSAPVASLSATTTSTSTTTAVTTAAVVIEDEDDPGTDHALPLEDDPTALGHSPVWTPQTQQSTCEFTHTITQYSQKRESGCKKAEYSATTVDSFGNRWRLIVYVNGNGRASNHHLSLFLQVADADDLPFGWKKAVSYVLTLEHPSGPSLGYAKRNPDKTFKLCPKAIDWGWSQFITSDRIQQDGYISNDSLTVRAAVTVKSSSVSIDPEDAELYLKCAVEEGNDDAVEACLSQGAGVNCQFKDDLYTPLHTACSSSTSKGSLEVLKLLLKHGADCNACNKWRETPLLIAANNGYREAVEALLENGANPALCSEAGWSALTFAAHKGYDDIVSLLLSSHAPVNCRVTEDLSTPLHKACAGNKSGHLSAVKQLIKAKADVHALNKWRETPLLTAANHGQAAIVEVLLQAGSDPCKCTDTGWSPLSIAAYKGHDDVVRLLLEEGAPTEEADPTLSALLQAATKGLPETVELLLRHGADHTVTTKKGDTALSILVEQNLVDAAVEMVTEYKASVPRCSRDRKKVQRARLLINLRVKQQQKEGIVRGSIDSDDDSEQDEYEERGNSALHDSASSPTALAPGSAKKKKIKSKMKSWEVAEADARAAEEALLLELDQEDAQAQKDEAAAKKKKNNKKKKKERERQQKLTEEKLKREQAQKEAQKRELEKKQQEEKKRKLKAEKERQEREAKEKAEREAALKLREKEEREKRQKEQEKKRVKTERERKLSDANNSKILTRATSPNVNKKEKNNSKAKGNESRKQISSISSKLSGLKDDGVNKATLKSNAHTSKTTTTNRRGWETNNSKPKASSPVKQHNSVQSGVQKQPTPVPKVSSKSSVKKMQGENTNVMDSTVTENENLQSKTNISFEDELANMANGVVNFIGFDVSPSVSDANLRSTAVSNDVSLHQNSPYTSAQKNTSFPDSFKGEVSSYFRYAKVELPAVAIFRQEKLSELLRRCSMAKNVAHTSQPNPMSMIDDSTIRTVVYKWIVRATHDTSDFLDPVIPSWANKENMIAFFQRQLISETRRLLVPNQTSSFLNIEILKDAGSYLAELCLGYANEVAEFRSKSSQQSANDWADSSINITAKEVMNGSNSSVLVVDWAGHIGYLTSSSFKNLKRRYQGPSNQFLSAVFALVKRNETMRMLVNGTNMDFRLSPVTLTSLERELNVKIQLWADPMSVHDNNIFFGMFPDVDLIFGALQPFGKDDPGGDANIFQHGASIAAIPPLDSTSASLYLGKILDLLEATDANGVALSFALFLPIECFRDLTVGPTVGDLHLLDSRLVSSHSVYNRCVETLPSGHHTFVCGDGDGRRELSQYGSIFLLLQNNAGMIHFSVDKASISNVLDTVMIRAIPSNGIDLSQVPPSQGFSNHSFEPNLQYEQVQAPLAPPMSSNAFGGFTNEVSANPFSSEQRSGTRRRGRLFELVDDGDDDHNNDVDVDTVSGMLNSLMFQNNSSQDVDIEAISLMGIGGTPISDNGLNKQHGRFG